MTDQVLKLHTYQQAICASSSTRTERNMTDQNSTLINIGMRACTFSVTVVLLQSTKISRQRKLVKRKYKRKRENKGNLILVGCCGSWVVLATKTKC